MEEYRLNYNDLRNVVAESIQNFLKESEESFSVNYR